VRGACLDDDAQGQPLEVLWEHELDAEVLTAASWDRLASRGFDPPEMFSAYLHTLRWNCVTSTDTQLFQSPFRAGIKLDAYQLEPLNKALRLPRVNLFIADDVGLGKTIEAGLIARELLIRKKVSTIVVACPPSMLSQWQDEMEERFGLLFEVLDREYVTRVRQQRGFGVNPWDTHAYFIVSHRLLVDEAYAGPLRAWLGEIRPGSLLILDEAHHAAPASGARYAIDSKFTHTIRDLAYRFEHRLFLSATPHNGHSNSFSALLEILDPQRFCRGVPVREKKLLQDVMVRRLKDDLREIAGGFPRREVVQIDIDGLPPDAPELVLAKLLDDYRALREQRLRGESRQRQAAAALLISGLQQRLFSSIDAFLRTLNVHCKTVERHWGKPKPAPAEGDLQLLARSVDADDERTADDEGQLAAEEDAQVEAASLATVGTAPDDLYRQEWALLERMRDISSAARGLPDARVRRLVDWIREHMCPGLPSIDDPHPAHAGARWNDLRVIVFTEYEDTRRYLQQQLEAAIAGTDRAEDRIAVFTGATPRGDRDNPAPGTREWIKRAFNALPSRDPVRILIANDAAREGLNLQAHCWNLFHFDVPWNPSRMEQRNGRIDRKLQPKTEVFCHYFVYAQRPEDRILQVIVKKTKTIKRELGSLAQVVEGRLADQLERSGMRRDRIDEQIRLIETAGADEESRSSALAELEEARERQDELRGQIERLRNRIERSMKWIGLEERAFRAALSASLTLLGSDPLKPSAHGNGGPQPFTFPAVDQRAGADPSWAETLDALRPPRGRNQPRWEWRRTAGIRPVVFQAPETVDDDVVHLHLEHRVVRRLLGRFLNQGFVHHDLSRACLAQSDDAIPRVVLLGRLSLYGPRATRLHDEIIPVTARWTDPASRRGTLSPYGRDAESRTLEILERALLDTRRHAVAEQVARRFQGTAAHDVAELLPHLEQRGTDLAAEAEKALATRGEREAREMRTIIERQHTRVGDALEKNVQVPLDFDQEAKRQFEANRRHWQRRVHSLRRELETEPERVRGVYQVKAWRIDPVGLVYLWPVTG